MNPGNNLKDATPARHISTLIILRTCDTFPDTWTLYGRSAPSVASISSNPCLLLSLSSFICQEVDFEETVGCVRALRARGIEPEVVVVPDESHGLGAYSNQVHGYELSRDFFERHLF